MNPDPFFDASNPGEGWLCLDFVNLVGWPGRPGAPPAYAQVLAWARRAGALPEAEARALSRLAAAHPRRAARALGRMQALSAALYALFAGTTRALPAALDDALARALPQLRLAHEAGDWRWRWREAAGDLERPTWPVVWSAARLLTSDDLARVGVCANAQCGWLFCDASKNRSRRWCSMQTCGNAAKARRHQARRRAGLP